MRTAQGSSPPRTMKTVESSTVLRLSSALCCVVASELAVRPGAESPLRGLLLGTGLLLLLPVDVLPAIVVLTVRHWDTTIGVLSIADLVALVYLARLAAGQRILDLRVTPARMALLLFLLWTVITTAAGHGLYTALARTALYATVGVAVTYRARARSHLLLGVAGFAVVEVLFYLPSFPGRLWGTYVNDPSQIGHLLIAAILVICTSRLPRPWKVWLGALLLLALLMTLTRTIWFAAGVIAIAALLPRRWYVPLLLPPALAMVASTQVSAVTDIFDMNRSSGAIRLESFSLGLREFAKEPIFGHGWAFTSAVGELGSTGAMTTPIYNLWIFLGACTGVVGIALFGCLVALLAQEAMHDTTAYLFLVGSLATSLTEMHFYAGSLSALLFFVLTPVPPAPRRERPRATEPLPMTGPIASR
jgi:hypothetical protein